jgi:hypothetical protein
MVTLELASATEQFVVRVALIRYRHWLDEQIEVIEAFVEEDVKEDALKSKQGALEVVNGLLLEFRNDQEALKVRKGRKWQQEEGTDGSPREA